MTGSCGAGQKRGRRKCAYLSSAGKKSSLMYDETKSKEEKNRTGAKRMHIAGRAFDTRLGGYGYRGAVTAGDGSNQKGGKMGAGYVNLRGKRKRQQRKVRREDDGSSSNRLELAAFVLALRGTPVTKPILYLCDNPAQPS